VAWHTLAIGLLYSLVLTGLGQASVDKLLLLVGADPATLNLCEDYLRIFFWGIPFILLSLLLSNLILGEGNTVLPMLGYLISAGVNVGLDLALIGGIGWVPALGFKGAAWAGVGAQVACALFFWKILGRKSSVLRWRWEDFHWEGQILYEIYRVALPVLLMELLGVGVMLLLNRTLIQYHYLAVAVLGIFQHSRKLFMLPINSLESGVMPIAGYAYGARHYDRVKEVLIKGAVLAMAFLMIGWAAMQFYAEDIMRFFTADAEQIEHGVQCFQLATLVLPLLGPVVMFTTVLQATGKGLLAMCFSILRQAGLFLPALLILPKFFGLSGVWLAFSLAELLAVALMWAFFWHYWRDLSPGRKKGRSRAGKYWLRRLWSWLRW
jgi:putative MATE family efflux protein